MINFTKYSKPLTDDDKKMRDVLAPLDAIQDVHDTYMEWRLEMGTCKSTLDMELYKNNDKALTKMFDKYWKAKGIFEKIEEKLVAYFSQIDWAEMRHQAHDVKGAVEELEIMEAHAKDKEFLMVMLSYDTLTKRRYHDLYPTQEVDDED